MSLISILCQILCQEVYAFKSGTFEKLWAEIMFKFQDDDEKFSQEFDLGPELNSMSSLCYKVITIIMLLTFELTFI